MKDSPPPEKSYKTEYEYLIEHARSILIQRSIRARRERIICYAEIGEAICNSGWYKKYSKGNQIQSLKLFEDIGINKTDGYACISFYEMLVNGICEGKPITECFHNMETTVDFYIEQTEALLESHGKNPALTWDKIKKQLYFQEEESKECQHIWVEKCSKCGQKKSPD